ncbi:MAG: hypothetical protein WC089_01530 [Candidatus Paceibacterota bacterium]
MKENENISKIEDVKRRLYDRSSTLSSHDRQGVLHPVHHEANTNWNKEKELEMTKTKPTTFFKKFFIATLIFFVFAIGFAAYMFFRGASSVSNDNIDITVLGNAFTEGGSELPLQVEIVNRNKADLELANLVIEYPRGASDNPTEVVRLARESIGTIPAGARAERLFKVTLYGDQGLVRNVKIKLEYHPAGSNAIFTKESIYPVTINSSPISLIVDSPTQTSANQPFTFNINATLNTNLPEEETVLEVSYPQGFVFDSASPSPTNGNTMWSLKDLTKTTPFKLSVTGHMVGQDGDEQAFHVYVGTKKAGKSSVDVVYNSFLQTISIVRPFLDARVVIGGNDVDIPSVSGGQRVSADIIWSNNLPASISDVQISAKISGNVLDKSAVSAPSGFYDSTSSQIIWNKNTMPDLSYVAPGEQGRLNFDFIPVSLVGADSKISSPQIVVEVSIKGMQSDSGNGFVAVNNFSKKIIKIMSDMQLAASMSYVSGSLPPKAETETRYKISWVLSNSTNSISGAEARATLPLYVKYVGRVSGNTENISYNDVSREVIWKIGSVSPNTGSGSNNREADFVVSFVPSLSQVGTIPEIIKSVVLVGQDTFAGATVRSSRGPLNTNLKNDPVFKSGDERVIK